MQIPDTNIRDKILKFFSEKWKRTSMSFIDDLKKMLLNWNTDELLGSNEELLLLELLPLLNRRSQRYKKVKKKLASYNKNRIHLKKMLKNIIKFMTREIILFDFFWVCRIFSSDLLKTDKVIVYAGNDHIGNVKSFFSDLANGRILQYNSKNMNSIPNRETV